MDNHQKWMKFVKLQKKNKLLIIEDCAEAIGARYKDKINESQSDS